LKQKFKGVVEQNLPLIHLLYKDFENKLHQKSVDPKQIELQINKIRNPQHQNIMRCIAHFNQVIPL